MFRLLCTRLIDSTPPATTIFEPSTTTRLAAAAIASSPDAQKRLTVCPGTLEGQPARRAAVRPTLLPVAPSGSPQQITTSSTSAGSTFARSIARATAWAASVVPCVGLNAPRKARPIGVRAAETIAASDTSGRLVRGIPHRTAVIRRETVAVNADDVDIA